MRQAPTRKDLPLCSTCALSGGVFPGINVLPLARVRALRQESLCSADRRTVAAALRHRQRSLSQFPRSFQCPAFPRAVAIRASKTPTICVGLQEFFCQLQCARIGFTRVPGYGGGFAAHAGFAQRHLQHELAAIASDLVVIQSSRLTHCGNGPPPRPPRRARALALRQAENNQ